MKKSKLTKIFNRLGPGFITGASDDDPSGIGTYSQTGALFGYTQLWTALFTFPFMAIIQETSGRIGLVTGKGLAGVVRKHYSKKVLYFAVSILLVANTVNIGADLAAMAASAKLIIDIPYAILLLLITITSLSLQILVPYHAYSKILKYFTFSLLSYILVAFIVKQSWTEAAISTLIPKLSFNKNYLINIVAILGTTISPYLFFWQASGEVEEEVDKGQLRSMGAGIPRVKKRDFDNLRFDTVVGMLFSNIVMYFIIMTTASTLGANGITSIQTADQAALALKPLAGNFAYLLFAAGIVGTGFLAVPILAGSASYAISETFGWKEGLYRKLNKAYGFYAVIALSTIIGLLIGFSPIPPFKLLYYSAALNGICAPPLLVLIMLISNNKEIMGTHTNPKATNILGWTITAIMSIAALSLLF